MVHFVVQNKGRHQMYPSLILGEVYILPLASTAPVVDGGQDCQETEARRNKVGVGSNSGWFPVRPSADIAESGQIDQLCAVARMFGMRAGLSLHT